MCWSLCHMRIQVCRRTIRRPLRPIRQNLFIVPMPPAARRHDPRRQSAASDAELRPWSPPAYFFSRSPHHELSLAELIHLSRGLIRIPDKNCFPQFLSVACGGNAVPPCLRNASHFGATSCRAFHFQVKNQGIFTWKWNYCTGVSLVKKRHLTMPPS